MTRQEFKALVHRNQRWERFSGYFLFLFPPAFALWFLGDVLIDFVKDPSSSAVKFVLVVALGLALLCAGFAWWGLRKINRKFKTFILFRVDSRQMTAQELVNVLAEKLNYRKVKDDSGLLTLHADGWQTAHEIYTGSDGDELFADLRLDENYGFFSWTTKKLKKRLINEVLSIGKERQCEIVVETEAE